jgi:hypothetical protein
MSPEEEEIDKLITMLVETGAIEPSGYDKRTDSFTYRVTPKLKEIMPELYQKHFEYLNEIAFDLWQKGYVEIKFDNEGTPMVFLMKGMDYESLMDILDDDSAYFIQNLMDMNKLI